MTAYRLACAVLPLVLLAGCDKGASGDDARAASGTVLEGTISDAMLPLDAVKSEPPFEDPQAAERAQAAGSAATPAANGETPAAEAPAAAAEPADAAEPAEPAAAED